MFVPQKLFRKENLIYWFAGSGLFLYILVRALRLSITYDEAWTIMDYVPLNLRDIILYNPADSNNHMLNTLIIKVFYRLFGHELIIARIPNVLAFVAFFIFSIKISREYLSKLIGFCFLALLMFNPFLLDFFSLARGYGMALAFQMAAIYFLLRFHSNFKLKNVAFALASGAFAVLSHFTFLYFWLGLLAAIFLIWLWNRKKISLLRLSATCFGIATALAAISAFPLLKLKTEGELYYGGNSDFYHDTLLSITSYTLYNPYFNKAAQIITFALVVIFFAILIIAFLKKRRNFTELIQSRMFYTLLMLMIPVALNVLLFYSSGTLYLIDRTALFYIPLLILVFVFSADQCDKRIVAKFVKGSVILLAILMFFNFIRCANIHKTVAWYYDAYTHSILKWLNDKAVKEDITYNIDYSWPFESSIVYYDKMEDLGYLHFVKDPDIRDTINDDADYYIFLNRPLSKVHYNASIQLINQRMPDTVLYYKNEGVLLFTNISKKKE